MSDLQKKLQEPLKVSDIDWRVQSIRKQGQRVVATLLAYKDSRVDQKRLDDVFGIFGWSVSYQRDTKGILQATVSVYDDERKQWISKTSNGTESFADSQKGEYSDAFKRASFLWGIGRELYDMPNITVELKQNEYYERGGSIKAGFGFRPNDWLWTVDWDYVSKQGQRTGLISAKEGASYRVSPKPMIHPNKAKQDA